MDLSKYDITWPERPSKGLQALHIATVVTCAAFLPLLVATWIFIAGDIAAGAERNFYAGTLLATLLMTDGILMGLLVLKLAERCRMEKQQEAEQPGRPGQATTQASSSY